MNFVTGASGLLGTHITLALLAKGEKVRAIRRPSTDLTTMQRVSEFYHPGKNLTDRIEWFEGDVLDIPSLLDVMDGVDTIYHNAAIVSYHRNDHSQMDAVNVEGTFNVVNCALEKKARRLCHISSVAALGKSTPDGWVDERAEWKDSSKNTHYGITKNLSELEVWRGIQEGLPAVIVNPGFIIGPGNNRRSSFSLYQKISDGLNHYPAGGTGFIGARDCANKIITIANSDISAERFILVSENILMKELLASVAGSINKPAPTKPATPFALKSAWIADGMREFFSGKKALVTRESIKNLSLNVKYRNDKALAALGEPFWPVNDAIKETGEYFRKYHS